MPQQLTGGSRFLASALALALAFASSATCVAAVLQMAERQQQHACCHGVHRDCGDAIAAQKDCCAVQSADLARGASATQSVAAPALVVVHSLVGNTPSLTSPPVVTAFDPGVPRPSSSPTYLLVSAFRL
jgi:hypothetical protein